MFIFRVPTFFLLYHRDANSVLISHLQKALLDPLKLPFPQNPTTGPKRGTMFCFRPFRRRAPKAPPEDKEPAQPISIEGDCVIVPFGDTVTPVTLSTAITLPARAHLSAKPPTSQRSERFDHQCVVCAHYLPTSSFARPTQTCIHSLDICLRCLRRWLKTDGVVTPLTWNMLSCPSQECAERIQHSDMKRLCSQELFER